MSSFSFILAYVLFYTPEKKRQVKAHSQANEPPKQVGTQPQGNFIQRIGGMIIHFDETVQVNPFGERSTQLVVIETCGG